MLQPEYGMEKLKCSGKQINRNREEIMKNTKIISFFTLLIFGLATAVYAEDNPAELVQASDVANPTTVKNEQSPEECWQTFLDSRGWNTGTSAGGVIIVPDRDLIISSASVFTKTRLGQPGWIESRVFAFEQAEMEAKAKIIRYLSETVDTKRSIEILEKASWDDGEVNKIKQLDEATETLKRIGKKSLVLAETKLDSVIKKIDPDYDPEKYKDADLEELQVIAEDKLKRQIQSVAMKTLIGVTQLYSAEKEMGTNEYQVLVGVIWSPKLNRLAMSLFNKEYNIPPVDGGKKLTEYIPTDDLKLLATLGTRVVIDENGQYSIIAYGQAQPRRSAPSRKLAALSQAKQIAANRAKGQIVNFIKEGMTLRESELSQELSREFSDMTVGTNIIRDYQKVIKSKKVRIKFQGLRVLKEWAVKHPATGQEVAGAIVVWSPASAALSKKAAKTMQSKPAHKKPENQGSGAKAGGTPGLESMKVDTSAY